MKVLFYKAAMVLLAAGLLSGCATTTGKTGPDKVVYHVNESQNANTALRNIGNHLEIDPSATIVLVAHAQGVDFLMNDAKDKNGNPYNIAVETLKAKGVKFDVCEITLKSRKLDKTNFIPEATFVPSGVVEISKLQNREGFVYIKP